MTVFRMVVTIDSPVLGGTGVNIWHLRNTGSAPDPDSELNGLSELVHTFYSAIANYFKGDTTIAFDGTMVEVGSAEPEGHFDLDTWSVVGGTTTDDLPPANCIVVGWRTSVATRSGRGRTFLGPLSRDTLQDNGTPQEDVRSGILAAANALISSSEDSANGALGVWSVKQSVLRDFTGAAVTNQFAVLRSRRD
jgi:hypothetical protein